MRIEIDDACFGLIIGNVDLKKLSPDTYDQKLATRKKDYSDNGLDWGNRQEIAFDEEADIFSLEEALKIGLIRKI